MTSPKTFLVFLSLAFIPLLTVSAQQKYALVIGNAAYTNIGRLNNPVNDANDMTTALQGLGFQVDTLLNGSRSQMEDAVIRLKNRLSTNSNAYGFFFYAGHGVQANGENYLIPVDADIKTENLLRDRAVSIQFTLAELNDAENALNIVVLDACRDNPFPWGRGASRGLQVVGSQPADSIVVYATSAGTTAADGTGRNGLFTTHLLNNLKTSGLEIAEVFRRTGADVSRASDRKQIPAVYNQFFGIAYLGGTVLQPAPISQPVPAVMAPQTPRNVRAGTPGTDRVTLNWDSVGAGVSYKVYYNTQNDPTRATALSNLTTGISMTITGLGSGTNYYFWVSTVKDGQESGKSPMVTVLIAATVPVNPAPNVPNGIYREEGIASWYGQEFNERATASGEIFDASQHTAAHPTLPFGTLLTVTNKDNGKRVMVRVNDRFRLPNNQGRIIDISRAAAEQLDLISSGTAPVIIESVGVLQSGGAR